MIARIYTLCAKCYSWQATDLLDDARQAGQEWNILDCRYYCSLSQVSFTKHESKRMFNVFILLLSKIDFFYDLLKIFFIYIESSLVRLRSTQTIYDKVSVFSAHQSPLVKLTA